MIFLFVYNWNSAREIHDSLVKFEEKLWYWFWHHTNIHTYINSMSVWHGLLSLNVIKPALLLHYGIQIECYAWNAVHFLSRKSVRILAFLHHKYHTQTTFTSSFFGVTHIVNHAKIWIRWNCVLIVCHGFAFPIRFSIREEYWNIQMPKIEYT